MPRLPFLLGLVLVLAACSSDEVPHIAAPTEAPIDAPEPPPDTMALSPEPDTMAVADEVEGDAGTTTGSDLASTPNVGSMERPLAGVQVCEELEAALLAMRINAYDLDLYAAQPVIDELRSNTTFRDPETGQSSPGDVASWVDEDVPGQHCSLSAGGDAWYRIQLVTLTDGRGDYATGYDLASSYDRGGP